MLKAEGIPVTVKEYLHLLECLHKGVGRYTVEQFYFIAKTTLVKHEKFLDRFDHLFGHYFKGMDYIPMDALMQLPEEWLKNPKIAELTEEEKAMIEAMGGWEELRKRFEELLKEQKERHEGGNQYIGTGGKSPYGAEGYNPEGYRVGQSSGRRNRAVKVWDKRMFNNLSDDLELNTRNMKMALRRLRLLTREGIADELDIDGTIRDTCDNAGIMHINMRPSKENKVKVLLLFDIGGTMDGHVETCSRLFSAARHEFKHMEYYYFHNCLYETVWKDSWRRHEESTPTMEMLHKYPPDYKVIVVGDAYMSPYEIMARGGSVEHYNDEAGKIWLERLKARFPYIVWLNPNSEQYWTYSDSTHIIREVFEERMFPLTLGGLGEAMRALKDKRRKYQPSVFS